MGKVKTLTTVRAGGTLAPGLISLTNFSYHQIFPITSGKILCEKKSQSNMENASVAVL